MVDRSDDASCLLGLEGLAVERVVLTALGTRIVQLVTDDPDAARCPGCRVVSTSGKDWVLTRPHDLPCGGGQVAVQWRKRRWRCRTTVCPVQTFTEQIAQVPAGMRTTTRLRTALAVAVEDGRDQSEVAAAHGVSWPTVQRAVVVHAAVELAEPGTGAGAGHGRDPVRAARGGCPTASTMMAGSGGCARIRGRPGSSTSPAIKPCWGRSTAVPAPRSRPGWPPAPTQFRVGVEVVVIDPHAGYAAAVRAALPDARYRGRSLPPDHAREQGGDRGASARHT